MRALEALHELEDGAGRTPERLAALGAYSGWGGAADAFRSDPDNPSWAQVGERLRGLLSDDEYAEARSSTLTAFYTPAPVVAAIHDALRGAGWGADPKRPDALLEPGCGTGNFMRAVPDGAHYAFHGIEADPVSARIAQLLLPDADVVGAPMESCLIPSASFDAAVGNVPYSNDITIADEASGRRLAIHDWFILHSLDAVRPGGLVAVLTSRYTLDKADSSIREEIARRADLVAAVRLPEETFRAQAGTDALSDILVLRRIDGLDADASRPRDLSWTRTDGLDGVPVNRWILAHPENVVGRMGIGSGPWGPAIQVRSGLDAAAIGEAARASLSRQLAPLGDLHALMAPPAAQPDVTVRPDGGAQYEHFVDARGNIWYGDGGTVTPAHGRGRDGDERLRAMLRLRDQAAALLELERDPKADAALIDAEIASLDRAYDRFAERWGRLADRANQLAPDLAHRPDASIDRLYGLERVDADGRYAGKADMLSRRVIMPVPDLPDHVDDPSDALTISLDRTGGVDPAMIARLLGVDETTAMERLGDAVVTDPDTGAAVTADEYLSGDVAAKLDHVDALLRDEREGPARRALDAWLDRSGIRAAETSPAPDGALAVVSGMHATGVWESFADPMHASRYVAPEAFRDAFDMNGDGRWAPALACLMLDAMRPGHAPLTERSRYAGTTVAAGPWALVAARALDDPSATGPREADGTANSPWRALWRMTRADSPLTAADLAPVLRRAGSDATLRVLREVTPGRYWDEPRTYGYGHSHEEWNRVKDPSGLASWLLDHPETCEYLYAADLERRQRERPVTMPEAVSREDAERYARDRAAFLGHETAAAPADPGREARLSALRDRLAARMPARLGHGQIAATLGAAWIPPKIIRDFIGDVFGMDRGHSAAQRRHIVVSREDATGNWSVNYNGSGDISPDVASRYGTKRMKPFAVLESALNASTISITAPDPRDPEGKRRVRDPQATAMAWQKRHAVEQAFADWVWADPERRALLEDAYNRTFNTTAPRRYDGSYLTLPGHNAVIDLYPHQKDAIARILQSEEGTLVAHVVGAGKTFTGIAATREAKRLGKASKPMIVVPNHLTGQWAADYQRLYPGSKVIAMTAAEQKDQNAVRRFWARVASGDWDAVIVGHDRFSGLHVGPEARERYMGARLAEMDRSIEAAYADGNKFSVKQLEAARKQLSNRIKALRDDPGLGGVHFEDLGVDMLFVDEAHSFKNLAVATSMSVAGINSNTSNPSKKCEDLLDKCEMLREAGHGGNIVFATGTPVSNSMSELYNMQRYLAPGQLRRQGVDAFSNWAKTFGSIIESVEVKPEGDGFQVKQRFARFQNLPELMQQFHSYTDIRTSADLDLKVPDCDIVTVATPPSDTQSDEIAALGDRARAVRDGDVDPSVDNMLKITSDGRKIALDPKLLYPDDPDYQPLADGKVEACARHVLDVWERTSAEKGAQLVFCDFSTPASGRWNVYDDLKRRLVAEGIPADQIAFIHDAGDDPRRKEAMFAKVRNGEIRVLMGSTAKLGTGTNVQDRLAAIHDLDCPWRPSDLEQRLGRIQRQGNAYDHVTAYRYVTTGTFDAYNYQTIERKQRFISQIFSSDNPAREASDLDRSVLTYAETMALATGDPEVAERMNLANQIDQLKLLRAADAQEKAAINKRIVEQYQPTYDRLAQTVEDLERDAARFREARELDQKRPTVLGRTPDDDKAACQALRDTARQVAAGRTEVIGSWRGLAVVASCQRRDDGLGGATYQRYLGLKGDHDEHLYSYPIPGANTGTSTPLTQLERILEQVAAGAEQVRPRLEKAGQDLEAAREAVKRPWSGQQEYDELTARLRRIDERRTNAGADEPDPVDGKAAAAGEKADDAGDGDSYDAAPPTRRAPSIPYLPAYPMATAQGPHR